MYVLSNRATVRAAHGTTTAYRQGCRCDECRLAKSAAARAYRLAHLERERAGDRAYREAHRAERRVANKAEYAAHREEIRARLDAYDAANPERCRERDRRHRQRRRVGVAA